MAKPVANTAPPPPNNGPAATRKVLVAPKIGGYGPSLAQFLIVWVSSALINTSIVVAAMLIFPLLSRATPEPPPEVEQTTEVQDTQKDVDLTNTDLGDGEGGPLVYDNQRIEDVSVPGPVDPTAAVGIVNAPEAAPMSVAPPPGTGYGTGAAPIDPNSSGTGNMAGTVGGYGGTFSPGGFGGRSGSTKAALLKNGGGNLRSEVAVADGLKFLALHQSADGRWSLNNFQRSARTAPLPKGKVVPDNSQPMTTRSNDTAGTGFGLLPFLAAGITHRPSKGSKMNDYSPCVDRGINYLIARQSKSGNDRGFYGGDMYSHGIATIAMCEAYGLTSDPRIQASAQMGLNYIVAAQDPAGGGWRYSPRTPGDTSVTGWQLMALKSGQMAGLPVPRSVFYKAGRFLDSVETNNKGGYGYMPGNPETPTMTAVGALCRMYLGTNPQNPSLLASVERLKKNPPGRGNTYYEYYATQVMHHMGGEAWDFWNLGPGGAGKGGIRDTLIALQDSGGAGRPGQKGSFPGNDFTGGRLGATALSLLSLEVYYRHLPLYRREIGVMKKE